jgi:hypothetical protein
MSSQRKLAKPLRRRIPGTLCQKGAFPFRVWAASLLNIPAAAPADDAIHGLGVFEAQFAWHTGKVTDSRLGPSTQLMSTLNYGLTPRPLNGGDGKAKVGN